MVAKALFSSDSMEWGTPPGFFDKLNQEFQFTLNVCGTHENAKVKIFYDKIANGLKQPWSGVCWCNPPYGSDIGMWIKKAYSASTRGATVVTLLPARTDTRWLVGIRTRSRRDGWDSWRDEVDCDIELL